jgi:hypothetical protein
MRPGVAYPRLVARQARSSRGRRRPWGYGEFLEADADPKHERHAELLEWCGGDFDTQQFAIDEINRRPMFTTWRRCGRKLSNENKGPSCFPSIFR